MFTFFENWLYFCPFLRVRSIAKLTFSKLERGRAYYNLGVPWSRSYFGILAAF